MSEVMSPVPAGIGIESGISAPSFGGGIDNSFGQTIAPMSNINVGGLNSPDLNTDIFSMPELKVDSVETFDKVVPGNLAFTHTEVLWQAPPTPLVSQSEITQEVEADAEQAARVEKALIAIGIPQKDAEQSAMAVFKETLARKEITKVLTEQSIAGLVEMQKQKDSELKEEYKTQTAVALQKEDITQTEKTMLPKSKEKFFEKDTDADNAREEFAKKAIAIAFKKTLFGEEHAINGGDIVMGMPSRPQPRSIKSEIIQGPTEDRSYTEILSEINSVGEIFSSNEAEKIAANAITRKPAVRLREHRSSAPVTMKDVKRVIWKENVLEIKT